MSPRVVPVTEPLWRAILDALRYGPRTTGVLAEDFPTTRFVDMKHLVLLTGYCQHGALSANASSTNIQINRPHASSPRRDQGEDETVV